jgi:FAD-linked oxidoreductase
MPAAFRNWSGLVSCIPAERREPATLDELREAVRSAAAAGRTLRVVGSGHSFTPLVATEGTLVGLDRLSGVSALDAAACEATVLGGTKLRALGERLYEAGLGLVNQGDIDAQSLAGAISTGTHGTGIGLGSLSTQAAGLTLVTATGELLECSARSEPDVFSAARVSLGALGVIAAVRLKLRSAYRLLEQKRNMDLEACLAQLETLRRGHRHLEFFWFPYTERASLKTLDVSEEPATASVVKRVLVDLVLENGAFWLLSEACRLAPGLCRPVSRLSARLVSEGRRVDRSGRVFASPRLVRFNEMEYALPAERGPDCLRELRDFIQRARVAVHFPVEYRYVAADDIWLSPFYQRESAALAVHMYRGMPFQAFFDGAEAIFRNHGGRPHWGKLHSLTAKELAPLYPMWDQFRAVRRRLDPGGLFLNGHLRGLFGE